VPHTFHAYVPVSREEVERKLDLLAVSRGLLSECGRRTSAPNRSAVVWALVEEAFALLPEARRSPAEQDAALAPYREVTEISDEDVRKAVEAAGGNRAAAARHLGLRPSAVYYRTRRRR
jgi:transcriptional regulator with GAF, ATPase, and Fis domain